MRQAEMAVYLEMGAKRVFACALDWPGWCRAGRNEQQALDLLAGYARRYALVAAQAGVPFPADAGENLQVMERVSGSATTDFGAPAAVPAVDSEPLLPASAERTAALLAGAWAMFDGIVARAPAGLRKGPRGGGRDRDAIVEHVLAAEVAYARKLGVRQRQPALGDHAAVSALREAILEALLATGDATPALEKGWPPRYAARRIAWHVLDHAWEIEDRSGSSPD